MGGIRDELDRIGEEVRERFDAQKRVLSFWEYLELLGEHPFRHTRDASRYVRDCFDHYGRSAIERPWGPIDRFRLFDLPFLDEADAPEPSGPQSERLVGQEEIQHAVYRILEDFVREGRANRLILLHGPNGSAKSTLTRCVMRGLEHYSSLDEGALYRFSWVFPRGSDSGGIGFGSRGDHPKAGESYAHLPDERIDVKVPSALREHPLLLLPRADRERLVRKLFAAGEIADAPPGWVARAQLGHMSRQIYEALLTAYRGDFERVLAHVQVERWYISRRYRSGAVMIGPQMAVDASERQITADRTLGSLPASLSAVTLFEPYGELVDAAGGLIEYSDLLKRPLDAWKYLLLAIENGEVALSFSNLPLNLVMVASSNELHLAAFKEHPEYKSFRGRLHLVRVPYLLDYTREQEIYDGQIIPRIRRHVGPHTTYVAALWSVLTRLERANPERYADVAVGRLAASLTPLEKAEIYATGALPSRLSAAEAKTLLLGLEAIRAETADAP
ncbi:MAG: serine protein kinase PrkA, partial [Myxococcales bacterium]|nr:serine protein kinase PrkA [Myxococcales bacterium]